MNPQNKKRLPASPKEWMAHALSDLKIARLGQKDADVLHEQICFHTQQAVEKAFKAVLLFCKVDFPLTHDLDELVDILSEARISMPAELMDVGALTPYAVETRYPGHWGEITGHDVDEAIKLSGKVLKWSTEYIAKK